MASSGQISWLEILTVTIKWTSLGRQADIGSLAYRLGQVLPLVLLGPAGAQLSPGKCRSGISMVMARPTSPARRSPTGYGMGIGGLAYPLVAPLRPRFGPRPPHGNTSRLNA